MGDSWRLLCNILCLIKHLFIGFTSIDDLLIPSFNTLVGILFFFLIEREHTLVPVSCGGEGQGAERKGEGGRENLKQAGFSIPQP